MRSCILCAHFWLDSGIADWSEHTPGAQFQMGCGLRLWRTEFDPLEETEKGFRERLLTAETCPKYLHHTDKVTT